MPFEVDIFTHLAIGVIACIVGVFHAQNFRVPVIVISLLTAFLTFFVLVPAVAVLLFHYALSGLTVEEQRTVFKGMIVIGGLSGNFTTLWLYQSAKATSEKRMTLWEMIHEIRHGEMKKRKR